MGELVVIARLFLEDDAMLCASRRLPRPPSARPLLTLACGLGLALLASCSGRPARPGIPPAHLLLLTVDHLRADHLGAYAYGYPTTFIPTDPNLRAQGRAYCIDDLVTDGVAFANAFAPSGHSLSSLASLMSGRSARAAGVESEDGMLAAELTTLAEALGDETTGGRVLCAAFVSGATLPGESGLEQGFAVFERGANDLETLGRADAWAREHDFGNERPVFVWVHLAELSPPYELRDLGSRLSAKELEARFLESDYAGAADGSLAYLERLHRDPSIATESDLRRVGGHYDAELSWTNSALAWFVGRFQFFGSVAGVEYSTLIVLAGTHGSELGQRHGYFGSQKSLHDAVLRVPLSFRHIDSLTGARVLDDIVELADVMPTLLDWFGRPLPSGVSGRSLLALTDSYVRRPFEERHALTRSKEGILSLRTPDWRMIWNPDGATPRGSLEGDYPVPAIELFDLRKDRLQLRDVAAGHPEVVESLKAEIEAWLATGP